MTPWISEHQAYPVLPYLLEFSQIHVDWVSGAIQPSHLTHPSLFLLPSIFPSIKVFSSELALHIRWLGTESSASASVFLMKILGWFPLGLTGLFSLQPKYSQVSSPAPKFKDINSSALSLLMVQLSHLYMTTGKTMGLTIWKSCHFLVSSTF